MQTGRHSQEPNYYHSPKSSTIMMSPKSQSLRQFYGRQNSAMVTPNDDPRMNIEQWMARRMRGEVENFSGRNGNGNGYTQSQFQSQRRNVNQMERMEVLRAVFGILRDNLPPSLEAQTSLDELTLVAESIESKLYATASSPRAYCALSTLEFRITALATAVLIHSDKQSKQRHHQDHNNDNNQGISDTCARLSAAARKSLVYCVMVLVSFEKKDLDNKTSLKNGTRMASGNNKGRSSLNNRERSSNGGSSSSGMLTEDNNIMYCGRSASAAAADYRSSQYDKNQGQGSGIDNNISTSDRRRMIQEMYSQRCADRMVEEMYSQRAMAGDLSHLHQRQFEEKDFSTAGDDDDADNNNRVNNAQIVMDEAKKMQPFPPSA